MHSGKEKGKSQSRLMESTSQNHAWYVFKPKLSPQSWKPMALCCASYTHFSTSMAFFFSTLTAPFPLPADYLSDLNPLHRQVTVLSQNLSGVNDEKPHNSLVTISHHAEIQLVPQEYNEL
jgi:hypothetical protein